MVLRNDVHSSILYHYGSPKKTSLSSVFCLISTFYRTYEGILFVVGGLQTEIQLSTVAWLAVRHGDL